MRFANLQAQGMDDLVLDRGIQRPEVDMTDWRALENKVLNLRVRSRGRPDGNGITDTYLSIVEALKHAGCAHGTGIPLD